MATVALSANQQAFAGELQKDTGLNLYVLEAWLRNEESAISSNGALGANNFLNIGITGSSPSQWYGNNDPIWNSPLTAADATAQWLEGKPSVAGYGTASAGIQAIAGTAKQSASAQINAIQTSGWAGGHAGVVTETAIPSLYSELAGGGLATASNPLQASIAPSNAQVAGASTSPSSGSSSTSSGATFLPGGYISAPGGILSALNPFNAITGVWDAAISDAKYAGLFIAVLAVAALLMIKGISANGVKTPQLPSVIPVPV
jgi:hypothetical protein